MDCGGYERYVSNSRCPCKAKSQNASRIRKVDENYSRTIKSTKAIELLLKDIKRAGNVAAVKDLAAIRAYISHRDYCYSTREIKIADNGIPRTSQVSSVQHIAPIGKQTLVNDEYVIGMISVDNMSIMPTDDNVKYGAGRWDRESGEYISISKLPESLAVTKTTSKPILLDLLEEHLGMGVLPLLCKENNKPKADEEDEVDSSPPLPNISIGGEIDEEDIWDEEGILKSAVKAEWTPEEKAPASKSDLYKHEAFSMTLGWLYDAFNDGDEGRLKQQELTIRQAERERRKHILYHQPFDELSPNDKRRRQWLIWSHKHRMWGCAIEPHFMVKWTRKPTDDEEDAIKQYLDHLERQAAKLTSTWKLKHALDTSDSHLPDPTWMEGKFQRMPDFTKREEVDPSDPNYLDSVFGAR